MMPGRPLLLAVLFSVGMGSTVLKNLPAADRVPVMTVCSAGVDRLLEDIEYLSDLSGRDRLNDTVALVLQQLNGLDGLDRSRPVGALLFSARPEKKDPDGLFVVPVTSAAGFSNLLESLPAVSVSENDDEHFEVTAGGKKIAMRITDDYAFLSEVTQLVEQDNSGVPAILQQLAAAEDLSIVIDRAGLPPEVIERFLEAAPRKLREDAAKDVPEELEDAELKSRIVDVLIAALTASANGTGQVRFGLTISPELEGARTRLHFATLESSDLSARLPALAGPTRAFAESPVEPGLKLEWNVVLPSSVRSLLADFVRTKSKKWDQEVGVHLREEEREPLKAARDALLASIESGQAQGTLAFLAGRDKSIAILFAEALSQPQAYVEALRTIAPYAQDGGDLRELEWNVDTADRTPIHRLRGKPAREHDVKLYGGEPWLYFATGESTVWLAIGTELARNVLKGSLLESSALPAEGLALYGELHLKPWLPLIAADSDDQKLLAALEEAFADPVPDRARALIHARADGLSIQLDVDEAYLHLLAIAASVGLNLED